MTLVFNIALHLLLAGSIVIFAGGLIWSAITEQNPRERLLRVAGLVAGALVALGAQVAGVGYAQFIVESLTGAEPTDFLIDVLAAAIPGLLGVAIGFYIIRVFQRSEIMAMRVLSFIGMLATIAYLLIYAEATKARGIFLGAASIPNVAFVTGLILAMVFTHEPESGGRSLIPALLRNRLLKSDSSSASRAPKSTRHDPFAN